MISANMRLKGYVTTYRSIAGRSNQELELALGFQMGALDSGYVVYALCESVQAGEFEWKDRTSYSAGWHYDPSIHEYVQRYDELRAQLGKQNNWSEAKTDRQLAVFLDQHRRRLNVRDGEDRIVKVYPLGRVGSYPDSEDRNIPQWSLLFPKEFRHEKPMAE